MSPNIPQTLPRITYELADVDSLDSLVECVQKCFPAPGGEVMARALNITAWDYLSYTQLVCEKAIGDQMTWVAKGSDSQILGFCITEKLASAPKYSEYGVSPKFKPLFRILEELDETYLARTQFSPQEILHLYMLGVRPEFSGMGIAVELMNKSLSFAKKEGFKVAIAEATGEISQKICLNLGFEVQATVNYKTFEYSGVQPFYKIDRPESCVLVQKLI